MLRTSWIWAVPLDAYQSEQQVLISESVAAMRTGTKSATLGNIANAFNVQVKNLIEQPFPTKTILLPDVASVIPDAVPVAGQATIAGQGFYPGLVTSVLLGGNALPASNVSNVTDTEIIVTVPNNQASFPFNVPLAVQVNSSAGVSNQNNTLTIIGDQRS